MKELTRLTVRLSVLVISSTLCACVVAPKKGASYDKNCMVSTQKIELTAEQIHVFNLENCINQSCSAEIIDTLAISTLITTTSAIVSGSIALIGNTLYWAESRGKCPNLPSPEEQVLQDKPDEKYSISEEVISAKF